jgi:hypothetical protein
MPQRARAAMNKSLTPVEVSQAMRNMAFFFRHLLQCYIPTTLCEVCQEITTIEKELTRCWGKDDATEAKGTIEP